MHGGHLEETFRRIIADALARDVQDPRVGFVTVSEVRLNRDRTMAEVYYTVMGDEEVRETTLAGLKSCRGFLKQKIGDQVRMRILPELRFRYDDSLDRSFRIEELLERVQRDGESRETPGSDSEESGESPPNDPQDPGRDK